MERHLMPASAETEPIAVKYGTNDCNAVVYGDLAVWAKPFSLNLYVGTNMKSVAASVSSRITGLDNPAPSGSSTSQLTLGTKWHDTVNISCTPKDPVYDYQTKTTTTTVTRTVGPYIETQTGSYETRTYTTSTYISSGTDYTKTNVSTGTEYNMIYYELNGGDLRNGVPQYQNGTNRDYESYRLVSTPYEIWRYTYQPQERHQYKERKRYEDQKKETITSYDRTVTTTYSFSKWTFHGTSSQASGTQNTTISNLAFNINYDAVGNAATDDPQWNVVSIVTHDWTTYHTYYDPDWPSYWSWTEWTNTGSPTSEDKKIPDESTYEWKTDYKEWRSTTLTSSIPIRYCYKFDYWSEGSTSGAAYSSGATYSGTNSEEWFYAHWTENPHLGTESYSEYVDDSQVGESLEVYIKNKRPNPSGSDWFNTIIPTRFRFYANGGSLLYDCRPHGWSSGSYMPIHGNRALTIDSFDSISGSFSDLAYASYCIVDYDYTDGGGWSPSSSQCYIKHLSF